MALSFNEIRDRATAFIAKWRDGEGNEESEAQSFLIGFFDIFGISSRSFGRFEHKVKLINQHDGYIDLLWKGTILVEMKSRGKDLDKAYQQAKDYTLGLKEFEIPKCILVCDFERFRLYDLEEDEKLNEFTLEELTQNIALFGFVAGYQKRIYMEQSPVNIEAAERMGKLHDRLKDCGYTGHNLEVYLVRLLFCLFAEDTTIFNRQQFQDFIEDRTAEDGSDLADKLEHLFETLDTPESERMTTLDEHLKGFPYVNGKLFRERLRIASFDKEMRQMLLNCCYLDWSKISPAIFGAMFQSVMNPEARRNLGAHYTSEKNILKVIHSLFLDDLKAEFESAKNNDARLNAFHQKLSRLKLLDPACGCGNFLVIAYRELRLIELEILKIEHQHGEQLLNVADHILLNVDQMFGIEIEEFPAQIAQVALWLMDHQMNLMVSGELGQYFTRLPLTHSAKIVQGNALRIDWENMVPKTELSYILGNPPFVGAMMMNNDQREDIKFVSNALNSFGVLDYVSGWYFKAAKYAHNTEIKVAFVSTNSITQGEQVGILWNELFNRYKVKIHFAHRTFRWSNEASGMAAVHCVIIGFANIDTKNKLIFEYEDIDAEPHSAKVYNINPYLIEGKDLIITNIDTPICDVPKMRFGNMPRDGGHFIFTEEEKKEFLRVEPKAEKWIRPYTGAKEFINGYIRYTLWLNDIPPSELNILTEIRKRVDLVRQFRLASTAQATRNFANTPTLFCQIAQPDTDYLLVPRVSSETRKYIPIGFMSKDVIANDQVLIIPDATLYHFGVLTSEMHMAWVRYTCGRLESRFRYSKDIVYNNFPWPLDATEAQKKAVEEAAQGVFDARALYPESSLAVLYSPTTMPIELADAHRQLDRAVDKCYRTQPFVSEASRMEYLFEQYEKLTSLFAAKKKGRK